MLPCQPTTAERGRPAPARRTRAEVAKHLDDLGGPSPAASQRAFAAQEGLPRSTVQHWRARQRRAAADPTLVSFFESAAGLDLLKRLVVAAHLVFHQAGPAGLRPLLAFFEHAGLAPFLACSYGAHQALAARLQALVVQYGAEQRQRLAPAMPARDITLCEDENFHDGRPCLVAIEPCSNFILVEARQPRRDADTWGRAVAAALEGLPVTVTQVASDEARGLLAHARDGLGAAHSPDLMHVQQDLHRATALPLHRQARQCQEELEQYRRCEERIAAEQRAREQGPPRPGRPPDFAGRLDLARAFQQGAEARLRACEQRRQQVAEAVRGLGDDYHPFDRDSGRPVTAAGLGRQLEGRFDTVARAAEQAGLPPASRQKVRKARRVLPAMVAALAWFWAQARALAAGLPLDAAGRDWFCRRVLAAAYWEQAAARGRDAQDRGRLRELARRCHEAAWSAAGRPAGLDAAAEQRVRQAAREGAGRWVRSSSCVEGRNGLLALHHHGRRGLSDGRLQALTVLHNYWVRRADGSTAAGRFFGQEPRDLFAWLLERAPDPPRPAKRRPRRRPRQEPGPEERPKR